MSIVNTTGIFVSFFLFEVYEKGCSILFHCGSDAGKEQFLRRSNTCLRTNGYDRATVGRENSFTKAQKICPQLFHAVRAGKSYRRSLHNTSERKPKKSAMHETAQEDSSIGPAWVNLLVEESSLGGKSFCSFSPRFLEKAIRLPR